MVAARHRLGLEGEQAALLPIIAGLMVGVGPRVHCGPVTDESTSTGGILRRIGMKAAPCDDESTRRACG